MQINIQEKEISISTYSNADVVCYSTSALEVFLNDMRYINPRFTYLLTYTWQMKLIKCN